jgi:hypothetical protein
MDPVLAMDTDARSDQTTTTRNLEPRQHVQVYWCGGGGGWGLREYDGKGGWSWGVIGLWGVLDIAERADRRLASFLVSQNSPRHWSLQVSTYIGLKRLTKLVIYLAIVGLLLCPGENPSVWRTDVSGRKVKSFLRWVVLIPKWYMESANSLICGRCIIMGNVQDFLTLYIRWMIYDKFYLLAM